MILTPHTHDLIRIALEEDLGERGDVTSAATLPGDQPASARMTAKAEGVVAGLPLVEAVYAALDPSVRVTPRAADGAPVTPGTVLAEIEGSVRSLLSGERVALNFVQRLSGVATQTARYVAAVAGTRAIILDTRKTTPGWRVLEKYAVRMGGGTNHRVGLYDMVLIKDNHIDAAGGVTAAVTQTRQYAGAAGLPIVVEVRNEAELREALALDVHRILLDNMDTAQMTAAVALTAGRVPLEASGGIRLDTVRAIAETGVDYISVGALTHSATALDISMKLVTT